MPALADINQPDYRCAAYARMAGPLKIWRDVTGGTQRMRDAGSTYLSMESGETTVEFNRRLARSVLFPAAKKTREALVGMVFKENPQPQDDILPRIKQHLEDIDLAGTHVDVFAKELFTHSFDGHAFILVDMQPALASSITSASRVPDASDEIAAGRRPYWVAYTQDQAVNWQSDRINGEQVLTRISFEEISFEPDGEYGEKEVTKCRVLRLPLIDSGLDEEGNRLRPPTYGPVQWQLFKKIGTATGKKRGTVTGKEQFVLEKFGTTTLPRIPVAVVYGRKKGFLESEPPLLDLAYLNIDHWQQNSDYRTQLHALIPILVRKGMPQELLDKEKGKFNVGPGTLADIPTEAALEYVSHDGKALEATRQGILDCEQRMAMAGLSIMSQRVDSNITATEKRMDQGERTSELATMARSLKDGLETALGFHAQYLKLADKNGDGGSIELGVAQDDLTIDGPLLTVLNNMVTQRRLRLETLHAYMQRGLRNIDLTNEIAELKKGDQFIGEPPAPAPIPVNNNGAPGPVKDGVQ